MLAQSIRRIAFIAHDGKKPDMMAFAIRHRDLLMHYDLVATGTTGKLLETQARLEVERLLSGPLGGDVQIANAVVEGAVQAVFFFVDPLDQHPHEPDLRTLLRACNVHNVPLATNPATARLILNSQDLTVAEAPGEPGHSA
jgi:methylglyoxal synthase